jgi:hypothetical protein
VKEILADLQTQKASLNFMMGIWSRWVLHTRFACFITGTYQGLARITVKRISRQ